MSTTRPLEILFVDDERHAMAPTILALEADGHRVTVARDGTEALEAMRQMGTSQPDLIILDIMMPEGTEIHTDDEGRSTGVELYRKLRAEMNIDTPIVVLTVVTDPAILRHLSTDRRVRIVNKPFRFEELLRSIERIVR